MTWHVSPEVFEHYKQDRYDLSMRDLTRKDLNGIKTLSKEKRSNYANAPIGRKIFRLISEQEPNISFKLAPFHNKEVDALLYIPFSESKRAHIILNASQPLVSQIFAAAHEYYHYLADYENYRNTPRICSLEALKTVSEQKASRFAAELLLPAEALRDEVDRFLGITNMKKSADIGVSLWAAICILLVEKYEIPLKAVIFRLYEEGLIKKKPYDNIMQNYDFLKAAMNKVKIMQSSSFQSLHSTKNDEIPLSNLYSYVFNAYRNGFVSKEEAMHDATSLGLDVTAVSEGLIEEDDDILDEKIRKWKNDQ